MISIQRGAEPLELPAIRTAELNRLSAIVAQRRPVGEDFGDRFQQVGDALWERQHNKCCYCEMREQRRRNDVEHFRPKTRAQRGPGFPNDGYWWLAWTWDNLFFACRNCNQGAKGDKFPLEAGSPVLAVGQPPPGAERALLVDPARENPIDHIQFRSMPGPGGTQRWIPTARAGSRKGACTISDLKLDRPDLLVLYGRHVDDYVRREATRVLESESLGAQAVQHALTLCTAHLLAPSMPFVGLSYDALHELVPESFRTRWGLVILKP